MRPQPTDHPEYFGRYINLVKEDDLTQAFKAQAPVLKEFLENIPAEKWDYKYADGKWTMKEMIQHCIDAERVFAYRAMCIARKEQISLPTFEEDEYAKNSKASARNPKDLVDEFLALRKASEMLFDSFDDETLAENGLASNRRINVLSLGYITLGHVYHHKKVAEERYLGS